MMRRGNWSFSMGHWMTAGMDNLVEEFAISGVASRDAVPATHRVRRVAWHIETRQMGRLDRCQKCAELVSVWRDIM